MRVREIACIHYLCEGECDLGHGGGFYKECQHCKQYKAKKNSKPKKKDLRREKQEKRKSHYMYDEYC